MEGSGFLLMRIQTPRRADDTSKFLKMEQGIKMTEMGQAGNDAKREALRHLLLSFPELRVKHDGREVLDSLVEGAVVHLLNAKREGALLLAADVTTTIQELAYLEYSQAEVVASFERLEEIGVLTFRDKSHRSFVFDDVRYQRLNEEIRSRGKRIGSAMEAWKQEISDKYGLDTTQTEALGDAMDELLTQLAHNNGAEAAALLYADTTGGNLRFYDALNAEIPRYEDLLPHELKEIARREFFQFFENAKGDRRTIIVDRLNAAFFFHLLSIDPAASQLVRRRFTDKMLYLDTNVLFRLLGLQGPTLAYPAVTLLSTAEALGARVLVAQQTVREFHSSLKHQMTRLRATPVTRDTYQRIVAENPSDEWDFMAAYYRLYNSGQVSGLDEFERRFSQLKAYLEDWGVEIDEEAVLSDEQAHSDDFLDRRSALNDWTDGRKAGNPLDHDTFLPLYVRSLRGTSTENPSELREWFLTFDARLTPFEIKHTISHGETPTCMRVEDWLQVVRPFLPRTDDYERAFVAMLSEPLLYRRTSGPAGFPHIVEALHRLEKYEELPVPVVTAMIADDAFMRHLKEATTAEEEAKVVEVAARRATRKVAEENEALQEKIKSQENRIAALEQRSIEVAEQATAATERADAERVARLRAEEASEKALRQVQEERTRRESEDRAREERYRDDLALLEGRFDKKFRWLLFISLAGFWLFAAVAVWWIVARSWSPAAQGLLVVWAVLGATGLLGIPMGRRSLGLASFAISLGGLAVTTIAFAAGGSNTREASIGPADASVQDTVTATGEDTATSDVRSPVRPNPVEHR